MTHSIAQTVATTLNARGGDPWQDTILPHPGYDEVATEAADDSSSSTAVFLDGSTVEWLPASGRWTWHEGNRDRSAVSQTAYLEYWLDAGIGHAVGWTADADGPAGHSTPVMALGPCDHTDEARSAAANLLGVTLADDDCVMSPAVTGQESWIVAVRG